MNWGISLCNRVVLLLISIEMMGNTSSNGRIEFLSY